MFSLVVAIASAGNRHACRDCWLTCSTEKHDVEPRIVGPAGVLQIWRAHKIIISLRYVQKSTSDAWYNSLRRHEPAIPNYVESSPLSQK